MSFRGLLRDHHRIVVEDRREPLLGLGHPPSLALRIILDLIALDLAAAEIAALGMAEVEPAHRGGRPHGEALGEAHADASLAVEQTEQSCLLAVIGLRRISGGRTDAAILLGD